MVSCTLKYKSNILIKKNKISGNLFVTISASARGICTRKCEQILCPGTFILFISTNGCLQFFYTFLTKNPDYNLFVIINIYNCTWKCENNLDKMVYAYKCISHLISVSIFLENFDTFWLFDLLVLWGFYARCSNTWCPSVRPSIRSSVHLYDFCNPQLPWR